MNHAIGVAIRDQASDDTLSVVLLFLFKQDLGGFVCNLYQWPGTQSGKWIFGVN